MILNHSQLTVMYPPADHKRGFLMATTAQGSELLFKDSAWTSCAHFNRDSALNYRNIYRNFFNYMATPLHPLRRMGSRGVSRHKMHAVTRHKMHVEIYPVSVQTPGQASQDARALTCGNSHFSFNPWRENSTLRGPSQDARGQLCSSTAQTPPSQRAGRGRARHRMKSS